MVGKDGLDMIYAKSLSGYSHGYALYQPTTTDVAFPGACGFIDSRGTWHKLFSLHDEAALTTLGLVKPADQLQMASANCNIRWDPMHSSKMDEKVVDFKAGVDEAVTQGFGKASGMIKYSTKEDFGALLLTTPPVERRGYLAESPIKRWYNANVGALLLPAFKYVDDFKEHGLFVITETHSTKKCSLISWSHPSKEIRVGIDVGATGVANAGVHGKYAASANQGGWSHYQGKSNERMVVFLCGFSFKSKKTFGRISTKITTAEQLTRAPIFSSQDMVEEYAIADGEESFFEVTVERFGKLPDPVEENDDDDEDEDEDEEKEEE